jgi:hypothetical protein
MMPPFETVAVYVPASGAVRGEVLMMGSRFATVEASGGGSIAGSMRYGNT